jgi:hypothetical protein
MPEEVKALTAEEIEQLDGVYRLANNGPMGAFGLYRLWPRIRATLDARDAEIAALKRERDSSVNATARTCAEAVCVGCATGLPTRGTRHDYGDGGWLLCGAEAIRHAYPEAFKGATDGTL